MRICHFFLLFIVALLATQPISAQPSNEALEAAFDKICMKKFPDDGPGSAVLIAKGGQVVYQKAFGLDDLDKKTPLRPDMVFRIGSVTKQFTVVAILQLVQQKKIALQDDITRFIPDYPVKGKKITVEQLLNHTSGIKSYTNMPLWTPAIQQMEMTPKALVDFFKDQPLDFEPGTQYAYNNSGYVLLGYIIEQVTGMPYADYLAKNVFQPAGLEHTFYENKPRPIKDWANGFMKTDSGTYLPALPLSMSQPYAAGSLAANVEDLYRWTQAVFSGKLVSQDLLKKAHTPNVLPNGTNTGYGYGWLMGYLLGSPTVEHGGAVNGFLSALIYLPKEDICVAILANCDCNEPSETAAQLAALAAGHILEVAAIPVPPKGLAGYVGTYENPQGAKRYIRLDGGQLVSQRVGGSAFAMLAMARDSFRFDGTLAQIAFQRGENGKVSGLLFDSRNVSGERWTRTADTVPELPKALVLTEEQLRRFVGEYTLFPDFSMTVTQEGARLFAQATGQQRFEVFAKTELRFFLKVVDAEIEFVPDDKGSVNKLILHQGGRDMPGERVR
ncbi:MAG: serine hydrolase [Saprospiraceae bacterium]